MKVINKLFSKIALKRVDYDIFHPTYYDNYFLSKIRNKPYIITVYDMIHELFPADFPHDQTSHNKKSVLQNAAHIIAISESTKRDLVKIFEIDPNRISVIHLASSLSIHTPKRLPLPVSYILYVGSRDKYKNFKSLIEISPDLFKSYAKLKIVCAGGGEFSTQELALMGKYRSNFIQHNLTDNQLIYAYQHAKCLVVPSLYEGFGLPVLEAMGCGCPVVSSNSSSLPEVGGDAVVYFNPIDQAEMGKQILSVLSSTKLREALTRKGMIRVKRFSWQETANRTLSIYQAVKTSKQAESGRVSYN
jgi:glycosyltransferase involved in cell wall biosynthesis